MSLYFDQEEAIKTLQDRGYRVIKVDFSDTASVTTMKKLVEYFYARRFFYNSDRKFPASIDWKKDNLYASDLVRSRQKLGLSRKDAVREAAALVDALFKYESFLKLREPINHLTILTSRPVMDRICNYMNAEVSEVEECKTGEYIDKINKIYDREYAQRDFEKAAESRKKILEKLNDNG
ncbi:hypothetical protein LCGC14_1663220 [marine sediment metagenome]|uniref:Uncharacterized protein n=1 Tax=marine sediment metagenome TaxID=412755 RepID=A0A0F9KTI5_9ZZZZ